MNGFIPKIKAKIAIVDGRVDIEIEKNLKDLGLEVIKTISCDDVDKSISFHPDIVIHPIDQNTVVVAPNVFEYYSNILKKYDINIIKGKSILESNYPKDIPYNVGRLGNHAIHNMKYTDEIIYEELEKIGYNWINVKQGYSKCSLAVLGEDIGMTSDINIYKKSIDLGYDMLLINPGDIELEGQDYGFIGGCVGNLNEELVLFSGDIKKHINYYEIKEFLEKNNKKHICLSKEKLIDVGTIIVL